MYLLCNQLWRHETTYKCRGDESERERELSEQFSEINLIAEYMLTSKYPSLCSILDGLDTLYEYVLCSCSSILPKQYTV